MLYDYNLRDESEWDAIALTMEAFEDAGDVDDVLDDSVLTFESDSFETLATDSGAPVSYVSEWQHYMEENGSNF